MFSSLELPDDESYYRGARKSRTIAQARLREEFPADMASLPSVVIVDDSPGHLTIYGWLLQKAGLRPVPCLATRSGTEIPKVDGVVLVVMDYSLRCDKSPAEIAKELRKEYPWAPIVLLSDLLSIPEDMKPYVEVMVGKGNPEKLVATVSSLLAVAESEQLRISA